MERRILLVRIIFAILLFAFLSIMSGKYTCSAKAAQGIVPFSAMSLPSNSTNIVTITVTNFSDVVNGNISNVAALSSNPGPDGISFREALYASNGTPGQKSIVFHPSLIGDTITLAAGGDILFLSSGELTINGDINEDGNPDITLDGHLGQEGTSTGPGLSIVSSDNTITGLSFFDFAYIAIEIVCPNAKCGTKLFANNKIINNKISNPRGAGIGIGTLGITGGYEAPLLSDIIWQNTVISGNTIVSKETPITIFPAVGGADRNQIVNLIISGNHLYSEGEKALGVIVADVNSAYFGIPGPIDYSNHNLIDSLTITDNVIEAPYGFGIGIGCANYCNSYNQLQNVKISNNTIRNILYAAISLNCGSSTNNFISNVEISRNTITQTWVGIRLIGAESGSESSGLCERNNRLENVFIKNNEIYDYTGAGVSLVGGEEVSWNIVDRVIISGNNIHQTVRQGSGIGLVIEGGIGVSLQNIVQGIYILNNQINNGNIGILLFGGSGIGAEDNQVILIEMQENTLLGNGISLDIRDNDNGAMKNKVILLKYYKKGFECPPDNIVECLDGVPALLTSMKKFIVGGGTAFSDCGLDSLTFNYSESQTSGFCPVITRIYQVKDSCGLILRDTQTIKVRDTIPPVIVCPTSYTLTEGEVVPPPIKTYSKFLKSAGIISDNCDVDTSSFKLAGETQIPSGTDGKMIIARSYSISDLCGNTASCTQEIKMPGFKVAATPSDLICRGDNTGKITLTLPGDRKQYSFKWRGPGNYTSTEKESITGLYPGTYTVVVTDTNGIKDSTSATILDGRLITLSENITDVFCNNSATGAVDLTVSGGWDPYSYFWNNGEKAEDISGLVSGNYSVKVTDAMGCLAEHTSFVKEGAILIKPMFTTIPPFCEGCTSPILPKTSNNGITGTWYPFPASNLTTEKYTFIPDGVQCADTASLTVVVLPKVIPTFDIDTVICRSSQNNPLPLTSKEGISGSWEPTVINTQFSYVYTFSANSSWCANPVRIHITVTPVPAIPQLSVTQPDCDHSDGKITVVSPLGTGLGYSIDGLNFLDSVTFSGLTPGKYAIFARNAGGCTSRKDTVINKASKAPDRPVVEVTQPTCFIKTGTIRITNPLGENLTYSLDGKDYSNTTGIFTGVIPGTYFITVSNNQGCLSLPLTTLLKAIPVYNITENKTICQGQNYLSWTTSGTYKRKLQSKSGCDSTVTTILKVNPLYNIKENIYICQGENYNSWATTGSYKLTLQSTSGCDSIVSSDLTVFPSYNPIIIAHGDTLQAIRQYKTYQWYNESGVIAGATTEKYVISKSDKYHMVIKDENGCTNTSEVYNAIYSDVRINDYENFKYSVIPNPNTGQFTFRIDSDPGKDLILKLLNPLGQVIEIRPVKSAGINHVEQFNMSNLSKGIYFLNISSEQNLKTEKIIVQ